MQKFSKFLNTPIVKNPIHWSEEWYRGFKQDVLCGYLTKDDFTDIYGAFFPGGSATVFVDNTFRAFDRNNNGKVDFREFLTGLSKSSQGSFEDKMKWVFQLYDTDHNGLISKDEMFNIFNINIFMANVWCF